MYDNIKISNYQALEFEIKMGKIWILIIDVKKRM